MKLKNLLATLTLTLAFLIVGKVGWGQLLIDENFPTTGVLTGLGWTQQGTTATNPLTVTAGNLTHLNYNSTGNYLPFTSSGQDVYKSFTAVNSGKVYASFLINITSVTSTAGDYCFNLISSGTSYYGRFFVTKDASDNLAFGLSKSSGTMVTTPYSYSMNTTYLIVIGYEFNPSTTNDDVVKLWINPLGGPEVDADLVSTDIATDPSQITQVQIRQGTNTKAPIGIIDAIRVSTSWADVTPIDVTAPSPVYTPAPSATSVDVMSNITVNYYEHVYKLDGTEIADNDATVIGLKKTGVDVPFSYTIDADKKIITIDPTSPLDYNSTYNVTASVEDAAGNHSVTSINFTTRNAYTSATVSSSDYTVTGDPTWKISNIPADVLVETFEGKISSVEASTFNTYESTVTTPIVNGNPVLNGYKLKVTSEDGATTNTYTLVVTPKLNAATSNNDVDHNFDITYSADATWQTAISDVKVDGTSLNTADWDKTVAGIITIKPTIGNALLTTAGTKNITVVATGYADATVSQTINAGVINLDKSSLSNAPALSLSNKTTTVTATAKDQYENAIEGYTFKFDVTTTDANATTNEEYTVNGAAYNVDATAVALAATNASGVVTFDIVLPATMDGGDGISVQVKLNDGTTGFKSAISFLNPVDPTATISPATIAEHALNNATVTITIQNADFAATLDKNNYTLNNAPTGLTVASIARTDDKNAVLTLAYTDADNDFDTDVTNFSVKIAVAELVGATTDVTSNDITLTAVTETAPTATIAGAITSVTETTATWAGEATADGGEAITEKGICWGTATEPTTAGNKTTEGTGVGAIAGNMTGLTANTKYYVRTYATNSVGTAYSTEQTFNTYSAEPTNHVTSFTAAANGANLDLSWANNNGDVAPTHYLIKASTSNNITDPTDFTAIPADNLTVGSDNGVKVVEATATSYSWSGLLGLKEYFFKIYPFTKNADNLPNYKTAVAPAANATTNDAPRVETFANFTETGTSFANGTFVGVDGSTWSYTQCAGKGSSDTIALINAPSPLLGKDRTPVAEVKSGTIAGGIGTLGFKYKQVYTTAVNLDVYVNETKVATVTTVASTERGIVKTISDISVYITGDFTIKLIQKSGGGQVFIDDVTWTSYAPANPVVAAPLFAPGAGTYIGTQDITITSATEGASIYYTTDGSTPTDASTLYTAPISLSASATVKARAYKTGMDASPIVSAAYVIQQPVEVANIAALRAGLKDGTTVYKLTGEAVLTFQHANRNQKYIQDATGGILIDDAAGIITTTYNQYDGITGITGRMNLYGGLIQFAPVFNTAAATSTGNTVTPQVITLTELNTNFADYESELIKVNNVTFSSTGDFAASQNLNITDGSVTSVFRTGFATADYIGTAIPTTAVNIVAIAGQYNGTAQLTARSLSDFSDPNGISDNSLNKMTVYPNPFNNEIRFNGSDIARVTITSIIGQIVMDKVVMEENRINTQELAQGIYIVKFTNKKGESTLRKLIKE